MTTAGVGVAAARVTAKLSAERLEWCSGTDPVHLGLSGSTLHLDCGQMQPQLAVAPSEGAARLLESCEMWIEELRIILSKYFNTSKISGKIINT